MTIEPWLDSEDPLSVQERIEKLERELELHHHHGNMRIVERIERRIDMLREADRPRAAE